MEYEPTDRTSGNRSSSNAPGASAGEDRRFDNTFKVITAKRTYILCAPDEEALIRWISAMRVLLQARRDGGVPSSAVPKLNPPPIGRIPATPSSTSPPSPATSSVASFGAVQATPSRAMPSIEAQLEEAHLGAPPSMQATGRQRSATDAAKLALRELDQQRAASPRA